RRDRHAQPPADRRLDDREEVGPLQRIAAGEDEDAGVEVAELLDERERLVRRQLARIAFRRRLRTAVEAPKIARARDLPDRDRRVPREAHDGLSSSASS